MTSPSMATVADAPAPGDDPGGDVRASWLVRLRWGSVAGQLAIILGAWRLAHLDLAIATLLGLTGLMAATNLVLALWRLRGRSITVAWSGSILAFDMLQLTALLYVSGGAANPFSVFYLVQITAAAATLGSRWTWFLTALGVSAYAALFALPPEASGGQVDHSAHQFARHLEVMWLALTLASALSAFFVTRLTTSLARRDRQIAVMREGAASRERLSALTTLAAGAAHELATPLTTVAVVAGELERALASLPREQAGRFEEDIRLVRGEVARCRDILDEMTVRSGSAAGEMPATFTASDLLAEILGRLGQRDADRVNAVAHGGGATTLFLPRRAVARVVLSLVQNALDATPLLDPIALDLDVEGRLLISVRDPGAGMAPDVLARAGEPFFTTKAPGRGLGLGLFLARNLAEQLGGRLVLESVPGRGTTACLDLPLRIDAHALSA